jgi:EAL domain-containing protein (putative c-di-GMP-specific phosphodiesterase class I)
LGGDEFGLLLERCPVEKAVEIAEKALKVVHNYRFSWEDKSFEIGASIGVVEITPDSGNMAEVMSAADSSCYVAKDLGRNRIHVYTPDDLELSKRFGEMQWVHRITEALDDNRFILYAQKISYIGSASGTAEHFEVLVRMSDEDGSTIPPMAFIPSAERYNLMRLIDRWVVDHTLLTMSDSIARGNQPITCSINLSGQSLCDDDCLSFVLQKIEEYDVDTSNICFEITETAAVANLTRATQFIDKLRARGCSFSLDDFGSGLSSFGYLKNLKVDYLKIDGSFVRDIASDPIDLAMVNSINQIGHVMGIETIAEFVEDEMILERLREIGVDYAQGYGIARPVPLDEVL